MKILKYILVSFFIALTGCALSPKNAETSNSSDSLLSKQFDDINFQIKEKPANEKIYVFLGSAQHSQSTAFMNDILLAKSTLLSINPKFKSIILSNEIQSGSLRYPFATRENLNKTFDYLSEISKNHRLTLFTLISTHGNVDLLTVNIANEYYNPIYSKDIKKWYNNLSPNTIKTILISSCYSGSFVDPLINTNSIILTASASNRNSFGCNPTDKNTFFIQELFNKDLDVNSNWVTNFINTEKKIALLEKQMNLSPPSNPQIYVPNEFKDLTIYQLLN